MVAKPTRDELYDNLMDLEDEFRNYREKFNNKSRPKLTPFISVVAPLLREYDNASYMLYQLIYCISNESQPLLDSQTKEVITLLDGKYYSLNGTYDGNTKELVSLYNDPKLLVQSTIPKYGD